MEEIEDNGEVERENSLFKHQQSFPKDSSIDEDYYSLKRRFSDDQSILYLKHRHYGVADKASYNNEEESGLHEVIPVTDKLKPQEFNVSASDIVKAIIRNDEVAGIDIVEKILDPSFRFTSKIPSDCTDLEATDLSEAFAIILARSRSNSGKKGALKTHEKRNKDANEYAIKIYQVIEDLKTEAGITSIRSTVELLNNKKLETPTKKGEWHTSTLQDLQKRWKELGIIPNPKPK